MESDISCPSLSALFKVLVACTREKVIMALASSR
jgi:hypothetical protein